MKRFENNFVEILIDWYSSVKRDLPWRQTQEPYNVWLSEIILQQTRVDQGLPYYENFVEQFPTVFDLAATDETSVMKTWEGLGYYSRARNLHATAKLVASDLNGKFPETYDGLLKLKGVGPYTAAAIASICFDEAIPVLDGNVFRFVARHFGIDKEISDQKHRKYFMEVLKELIPERMPGMFNQAMMEFGATVCKPGMPPCGDCIFQSTCYARENQLQLKLPVKNKKTKVQERYIAYLIFDTGEQTLLRRRNNSIWNGLYEFHNIDQQDPVSSQQINNQVKKFEGEITSVSEPVKHLLSHRKLWVQFYRIKVGHDSLIEISDELNLDTYSWEEVLTLPRPKVIVNHLDELEF